MKCPYCKNNNMPAPPKSFRPFGLCPDCGRKSRAAVNKARDGKVFVHYSATGKASENPKTVRSFRATDNELDLVEKGKLRLVVRNRRITIAV